MIRRNTRTSAATLLVTLVTFASVALAVDAFKGTWKLKIEPDPDSQSSGAKAMEETVHFKGETMVCAKLTTQGWPAAKCDTDTRGGMGAASFVSMAKHKTEGSMKWTGQITGSEMRGDLVWTRADGSEWRYTLTGSRQ